MSWSRKQKAYLLAPLVATAFLLVTMWVDGGASGAKAAAASEHETSMTVKCEPMEGAVGVPRICQATVTAISSPSSESSVPNDWVEFDSFRCMLVPAGGNAAACSVQATPNGPGSYSVEASYPGGVGFYASTGKATIVAGAASSPPLPSSSLSWSSAGPAPTIRLLTAPAKKTRQRFATFTFTSTQAGTLFECQMDKFNFFEPCTSPHKVKKVGSGSHIFHIRAISSTGTYGKQPIAYHWRVLAATGR